ncbi:LPD7 domain-containing protein [Roseobacter litoralis]|uniref:LPD7 domain-containing protein n=1 Tax=Roseobacter litoralis TaxID=42443 RepID=UPI0024906A83|nr:LPD7 domain-containing protein [Roseobacter litoralis]
MPDTEPQDVTRDRTLTLSEAHSERVEHFASAAEAGRAFANADARMRPRVIESSGSSARKLAGTVVVGDEVHKSVPALASLSAEDRDHAFWVAYGARVAEKNEEAQNLDGQKNVPDQTAQPDAKPLKSAAPDGIAEPDLQLPPRSPDKQFSLPASFEERFILTREANRQDMFRSYDEKRPTISDRGDSLHTKNADRSTAMDMIELAAHRGWSSMKVKGPEDFRREMWIEATAQGINVQGYRPNDKDRAEADRRADLIGERVIERTDQGRSNNDIRSNNRAQSENQVHGTSNVVPMIDYKKGIEGEITGIGNAPYRDREGASTTPYVALELADGRTHKLWGVALPDMIDKKQLKVGDRATVFDDGKKAVTVKSRDPKTGEERDIQTFRREWGARDIDRVTKRETSHVDPVQKRDEIVIETNHPDRLEDRLVRKDAAGDPELRGAASILARLDAEMRTTGVADKDRDTVRDLASSELAKGIREGRRYDVQRLPNVSIAQQMAAKALTSKDISRIIDQTRVKNATVRSASDKGSSELPAKALEKSMQTERGRER